jgi:hypothetical protein
MASKKTDTIIVGAGISGLACAKHLQDSNEDFLLISKDIGGRILTSSDGTVNYGAFFVCSDFYNVLKHVKLKYEIKLRDFCFHQNESTYVLFAPGLIPYSFQFFKVLKILYNFRKHLRKFRKDTLNISQKKAIENDFFLYKLYMQNASDFVKEKKLQSGTNKYLSKGLYSTTFSKVDEMNAFSYCQFILPLITPIYTFTFEKEKMIESFKEKILIKTVSDIKYSNGNYKVKCGKELYNSKNIVLATQIDFSKKYANIKDVNKPVSTNMLHVKGKPKKIISRKSYQVFSHPSNVQAIANLEDGTYLFYYKYKKPSLDNYFLNPEIIHHHFWDPAGTINGHNLIECNRGKNMFLIGDYNVASLEESYITGVYAANQIIRSD